MVNPIKESTAKQKSLRFHVSLSYVTFPVIFYLFYSNDGNENQKLKRRSYICFM